MTKPIKGKDGKFQGSEGTGASRPPRPPRSGAERARAQREALDGLRRAGLVVDPDYDAQMERLRKKTGAPAPQVQTESPESRSHPVYGGRNWGVSYSDHWDDYTVNHGYYGAIDRRDDGTFIDYSDVPLADHETRWTCDQKDKNAAITVWQHREFITAALRERGFTPRDQVRIRVEVGERDFTVSPYDRASDFDPFTLPR